MIYSRILPYLYLGWSPEFGRGYLHGRRDVRKHDRLSAEAMKALQWQRLKKTLDHAYAHVPFYRRRFDEAGVHPSRIHAPGDLERIPILTRADVQANLESMVADQCDRSRIFSNATGGSTGNPMAFYQTQWFTGYQWALRLRAEAWGGLLPGQKVAYIWGADRDIPTRSRWSQMRLHYVLRQRWLNAYNVTPEKMEKFAHLLIRWKPRYIIGYANAVYYFASFLRERGLDAIRPAGIETSAEKLWDYQRETIESVFRCKVFDFYGSREVTNVAAECEHHRGLHVLTDNIYLELLHDGRPAEPGEVGEIIVTQLNNETMPFIRYQNGDLARPSRETCPCGRPFPLLAEVVGRSNDVITTPNGQFVHGAFFNHLFFGVEGVRKYQVYQKSLSDVAVLVESGIPIPETVMRNLEEKVRTHLGPDVQVAFRQTSNIPPTRTGKHRYIVSEVKPKFVTGRNG